MRVGAGKRQAGSSRAGGQAVKQGRHPLQGVGSVFLFGGNSTMCDEEEEEG